MDDIKTLEEYAQDVRANKNNPHVLADIHIDLAAKYAFLAEIVKDLQIEKADFWGQKFTGPKSLSDTFLEYKWRSTEGGKKELRLKYELKGLEKLMNAIKTSSVVNAIEAKNQF